MKALLTGISVIGVVIGSFLQTRRDVAQPVGSPAEASHVGISSTDVTKRGMDPNSPGAKRIGKGMALKDLGVREWTHGNLEAARRNLECSFKLLPESPETPYLLGRISHQLGDMRAAYGYFRMAFVHGSEKGSTLDGDPSALREYAQVAALFDRSEADAIYARIAACGRGTIGPEFPNIPEGLTTRAEAHARTGLSQFMKDQYKSAVKELDMAGEASPEDPVVAYYRALMHAMTGDIAGAKRFLAAAQAGDPQGRFISPHALRFVAGRCEGSSRR